VRELFSARGYFRAWLFSHEADSNPECILYLRFAMPIVNAKTTSARRSPCSRKLKLFSRVCPPRSSAARSTSIQNRTHEYTRALTLRISSRQSTQRVAAIVVISSVECESIANGKSEVKRSSSLGTLSNILIRVLFLRMPGHTYRAREGLNRFLRNGSANFAHTGREKYTSGADFARKSDEEAARVTYNRCTRTGFVCRESERARARRKLVHENEGKKATRGVILESSATGKEQKNTRNRSRIDLVIDSNLG